MCLNNTISTQWEYWEDYCNELERKAADRRFIESMQDNVKPKDVLKVPKGTGYVELYDTSTRLVIGDRMYDVYTALDGSHALVEVK